MQSNRIPKRRPFQAAAEIDSLSTGAAGALKKLIAASRSSGTLNLANRHLQQVSKGQLWLFSAQGSCTAAEQLETSCSHDILTAAAAHVCIAGS
jgi:hypothetical protein